MLAATTPETLKQRAERQIAEARQTIEKQKRLLALLNDNPDIEEILTLIQGGLY